MTSHARIVRSCGYDIHGLLYRLLPGMLEIGWSSINSIRAGKIMDGNNVLTGPTKELKRQEGVSLSHHR